MVATRLNEDDASYDIIVIIVVVVVVVGGGGGVVFVIVVVFRVGDGHGITMCNNNCEYIVTIMSI